MSARFRSDSRGQAMYSWWVIIIGFIMLPMMALAIEVSRYYYLRAEVGKCADAAALAAAIEIDKASFESGAGLHPTGAAWSQAQAMVDVNCSYLANRGAYLGVTGIVVNDAADTVTVTVRADLRRFFPRFIPDIWAVEQGVAQVGAFGR